MSSDSETESSKRVSDNTGDNSSQGSAERHERMLDDSQQGSVAQNFGRQSSDQRTQDSQNLVQNGALPDLMIDQSGSPEKSGVRSNSADASGSQRKQDVSAGQFQDPALSSVNDALRDSNSPQGPFNGRDGFKFNQQSAKPDAAEGKPSNAVEGSPRRSGNENPQGNSGDAATKNKPEGDGKKDATDNTTPKPALTPPEPITFENIQPSGYNPGAGGINGGKWDMHDRKAPTTADFFDKKNPTDYVSVAIDPEAHVKDGQLFYSKELDKMFAKELAQKYPDQKPEDRHMWLRAVDTGGAFRNTWGANGPTRIDVAVPKGQEGKINEHGHAAKNPKDAISLTMVPETDKDRVAALAKMPTSPNHGHVSGKDFGYRDERPRRRR